ncbi:MAG: FKBP-type peptidyl-prolyl cis-trans isomerase [Ilumatobacteraceae bacterium]
MRSSRIALCSVALLSLTALGACGNSPVSDQPASSTPTTVADAGVAPGASDPGGASTSTPGSTAPLVTLPKPTVKIPSQLPTKLVSTTLTPGTGPAAKAGDTVIVNYIGVRSADGTEIDNSYDTGKPFPVANLGKAQVIEGWNQGLIGVQHGERLQLDIPADLAYGDQGSGPVIKPGDALTFVFDIVAVIPAANPADAPKITVAPAANQANLTSTDLVVGTGDTVTTGKHVVLQIIGYRASDGQKIVSTWDQNDALDFVYGTDQVLEGIVKGIDGMKVGGRRQVVIPFALAFGEAGNATLDLPAATDFVAVIDLVAVY